MPRVGLSFKLNPKTVIRSGYGLFYAYMENMGDAEYLIGNAPFAWGPQLHKGNIFVSDYNSGLWIVKLDEQGTLIP